MREPLQGVDHVVIAVRDLDVAQSDLACVGFTLTPRGYHTMGSENHCVMFADHYLELLAIARPHPVTAYFSDFLQHGDGAAALVIATDDADRLCHAWRDAGIPADSPVGFSRPVELPEGVRDAGFSIPQVSLAHTPGGRVFACQHLTRDVVYRPEHIGHANGTTGLKGVTVLVEPANLESAIAKYEKLLGSSASMASESACVFECGTFRLRIETARDPLPEARNRPFFSALAFTVQSMSELLDYLDRAEIGFTARDNGAVVIASSVSHGMTFVFSQG